MTIYAQSDNHIQDCMHMQETHATLRNWEQYIFKKFDLKQTKLHCAFSLVLINMLQRYVTISFANAAICKNTVRLKFII